MKLLSAKALEMGKHNKKVKSRIALAFNITGRAVELWFQKHSPMLTTAEALSIIKEETGLTESEILTDQLTK